MIELTLIKQPLRWTKPYGMYRKARDRKDLLAWQENRWPGKTPPPIAKRQTLREYGSRYSTRVLVETGTHLGDTTAYLRPWFHTLHTIEIQPKLFKNAQRRFRHCHSIQVHEGDSSDVLPQILSELSEPALFWLDGHYSGGITGRGTEDSPIHDELRMVLSHDQHHAILVDDAHQFTGQGGYPTLDDLATNVLELRSDYQIETRDDIIRITPPLTAHNEEAR